MMYDIIVYCILSDGEKIWWHFVFKIKKKFVQGLLLWAGSKYLLNMEDHRICIETIFNSNGLLIIKPQKNIAV